MNKYYKLIALQIDDFESEIIDEINTGTKHNNEYTSFLDTYKNTCTIIVFEMNHNCTSIVEKNIINSI